MKKLLASFFTLIVIPFLGSAGNISKNDCSLTVNCSLLQNVSCNGNSDGSVTVGISSGGTSPYTYSWSDPSSQTTATATGLSAGTYSVTVTDAVGCTATSSGIISQPSVLSVSLSDVSCSANPAINAMVTGGTYPYTYLWSDPLAQTNQAASNLSAGSYTVSITDMNGCTTSASLAIAVPAALTPSVSVNNNITCNGLSNGSATCSPSGGTSPYTYNWSPAGQTTATATGLGVNTFTVNVTDAHGCTVSASVAITQPSTFYASISANYNTCYGGSSGSATVNASGGTSPYTYSWNSGGQTTVTATGLSVGTYTITVTDNNGCTTSNTTTIASYSALYANISVGSNVSCNGGSNGNATSWGSGGTAPYTYSWSNGQTNANAPGLTAGSYTITVTDLHGCTATASIIITQPAVWTVSAHAKYSMRCVGSSDSLFSSPGGGTAPYNYLWTPITGLSCSTCENTFATPPTTTTFTITISDINGCTASDTVTIRVINLQVNPTASADIICAGGTTTLSAGASGGITPYTYSWAPGSWLSCSNCSSTVASPYGTIAYDVMVTDNFGCQNNGNITVNVDNVSGNINMNSSSPCDGAPVILTASMYSGAHPYTYSWSPGSNKHGASDTVYRTSSTVNYTLSVTDSNGCIAQTGTTVTPYSLSVSLPSFMNICTNTEGTSYLYPTVTGGNPPYTYHWNTGSTLATLNLSGLSSGTYTVTVTDFNTCTATAACSVRYFGPPKLTITANSHEIFMRHNDTLNASGGMNYSWSVESSTHWHSYGNNSHIVISNTSNNVSYIIFLNGTDSAGCPGRSEYIMTPPTKLAISLPDTTVVYSQKGSTPDNINGLFAMVSGGQPPYTFAWAWSGGKDTTKEPFLNDAYFLQHSLHNGTYTVSVIDYSGTNSTYATGYVQVKSLPNENFQPGPDTTVPHYPGLPPIYYAGNVSVGRVDSNKGILINGSNASIASPTKTISFVNDTLTTTGEVKAGSMKVGYLKVDSIQVSQIIPKDSILSFGDPMNFNTHQYQLANVTYWACTCPFDFVANNYNGFAFGGTQNNFCNVILGIGTNSPDAGLTISSCQQNKQFSIINPNTSVEVFNIDQSGNTYTSGTVAIGTTTVPGGYSLAVDGAIISTDFYVELYSSWPDYVFEKGYKLRTIEELENYLDMNQHLPGLPSAKEIKEKGSYSLGEVVAQDTKQLEEMALYIIQLNKEVKELKEQNKKMMELIKKN